MKVFGADTEPLSNSPVFLQSESLSLQNPSFLRLLSTLSARARRTRLTGKRSTGLIGFGSNLSPRLSLSDHTYNRRCPLFPLCCPQDHNVFMSTGSSCSFFFFAIYTKKELCRTTLQKDVVTSVFMKVLEMILAL